MVARLVGINTVGRGFDGLNGSARLKRLAWTDGTASTARRRDAEEHSRLVAGRRRPVCRRRRLGASAPKQRAVLNWSL